MNKHSIFLLILINFFTAGYNQKTNPKYHIKGDATGFADSTVIYLNKVDSAFIINGKFQFSGSLKENIKKSLLRTKEGSDYKFFWLENTLITFKGEKGKFRDATIAGSKSQDEQNELANSIKTSGDEKKEIILFIQNHPNSIISVDNLSAYTSIWGKDTIELLYRSISQKMKNTSYGKDIAEFIRLNRNIKIGEKYIDFTELNTEGRNVSLSDFKGKVVLLEFWGSWCAPCRKGNPELVQTYNQFKDRGFDILGVAADDDKNEWIDAVKKDGLNWENVCDLRGDKNRASLIYGISYYPANFLIDKKGTIIAKDLRGNELRSKLEEILK